jgi:tRNA(Ile2) C34 agmatinyltransferase TiaS
MQNEHLTTLRTSADLISSILNWVCPECGGRMGGPGNEFVCHGKCKINWRAAWERVFVNPARRHATRGRTRFRYQ